MKILKLHRIRILNAVFFLTLVVCNSCIEEYNYHYDSYDNILAVQGELAADYENTEVKLSRSVNISGKEASDETNALVYVTDKKGSIISFIEIEPGLYKPEDINFSGEINNEYFLTIETSDGSEYVSDIVTCYDVPEIDSLYYIYHEIYSFEEERYVKGIDICIDTHWDGSDDYYLRWDYIETIQFWQKWESVQAENAPYGPCWQTKYCTNVLIEETKRYDKNELNQYPVIRLDEYDYQPQYRYHVLIRQQTINKSVYDFWEMVRENNEDMGNIFDKIPYSPLGNITCSSDPEKKVLGYFNAGSITTKNIYIKAPVFGINFANINDHCRTINSPIGRQIEEKYVYIITSNESGIFYTKKRECVDCAYYKNSTREKPDFWEYK